MKNIKVNYIVGSPYDTKEVADTLINNEIPFTITNLGNIDEMTPFKITLTDANYSQEELKKLCVILQNQMDDMRMEHVYIILENNRFINIQPGFDNIDKQLKGVFM